MVLSYMGMNDSLVGPYTTKVLKSTYLRSYTITLNVEPITEIGYDHKFKKLCSFENHSKIMESK